MNPFTGVDAGDLGVQAADIVTSGLSLVSVLGPILLIGLAFIIVPKVFAAIKRAAK